MKYVFAVIVVANLWLYAVGAGWLGNPPAERGRALTRATTELNGDKVGVGRDAR